MAFTGDAFCCTNKGYFPLKTLVDQEIKIWSGTAWVPGKVKTGNFSRFLVTVLSNGTNIIASPETCLWDRQTKQSLMPCVHARQIVVDCISTPLTSGQDDVNYPWLQGVFSTCGLNVENERLINIVGPVTEEVAKHPDLVTTPEGPQYPPTLEKDFVPINANILDKLAWLSGLLASGGVVENDGLCYYSCDIGFINNLRILLLSLGAQPMIERLPGKSFVQTVDGKPVNITAYNNRICINGKDIVSLCRMGLVPGCPPESLPCSDPDAPCVVDVLDVRLVGPSYKIETTAPAYCIEGVLISNELPK